MIYNIIIKLNKNPYYQINLFFRYKCTYCSYETWKACRIKEHIVKHLNEDETPMYKCDLCIFQTKHKASLSHHKKIHRSQKVI